MDRRLKVNFVPFSNFGDTSVPYMLNKLNIPFIFTHHTVGKKIIMTGSILGVGSRKDTIVWGSGIIDNNVKPLTTCVYKAVRGPRTLEKLEQVGVNTTNVSLGDPAMLLSRIYKPDIEKKYKLGVIPHIVDFDIVVKHIKSNPEKFKNTKIINPNTNINKIENFINEVNSCENIVSSCLHGIICAHSYGIPAKWMKIGNRLAGDDVKFYDHFESVGIYDLKPINLIDNEDLEFDDFKSSLNLDSLWGCRPWQNISEEYYVDIDNEGWTKECYFEGYKDKIWDDKIFKLK